jgi:acyl carrier protein
MRNKIKSIIQEVGDIDEDIESIDNLIHDGYLDSFSVLMLIGKLEKQFNIELNAETFKNNDIFSYLNSLDSIVKMIQERTNCNE